MNNELPINNTNNRTLEEAHSDSPPAEGIKEKISGIGQMIIGEIETIGGILTGDPVTRAEGEFNIAVGEERDDIETEITEGTALHEEK